MLKVVTIVGTRPEIIKMSRVIAALDEFTNHILVHTGQNYDYELNQIFFNELAIRKPNYFLDSKSDGPIKTIADVIVKVDELLQLEKPDAVLIYGDTNSGLAVIAAKRLKIPIFHMEAGNRCFDQRVPEEINRKIIDHLSDVNLVLSEQARQHLLDEGISSDLIIKTGSHLKEVLQYYAKQITQSPILKNLDIKAKQYFVVSLHREENVDIELNLQNVVEALNSAANQYQMPILVSTHPRTRLRLEKMSQIEIHPLIQFCKPFGFFDYIHLQQNAFCTLSDSGTITEEAALLGFPAVMLREQHERPEGMDAGILIMSGLKPKGILSAIHTITTQFQDGDYQVSKVGDYEVDLVSQKIIRIILSYTELINHRIWSK